jgi:hypothetical protein
MACNLSCEANTHALAGLEVHLILANDAVCQLMKPLESGLVDLTISRMLTVEYTARCARQVRFGGERLYRSLRGADTVEKRDGKLDLGRNSTRYVRKQLNK